jgi:hypothetical protein
MTELAKTTFTLIQWSSDSLVYIYEYISMTPTEFTKFVHRQVSFEFVFLLFNVTTTRISFDNNTFVFIFSSFQH